jgi:hypothetical protein
MSNDAPTPGETITEIAARYGRVRSTVSIKWSLSPGWPTPVGQRWRAYLYDPADVDEWVRTHINTPWAAPAVDWIPEGLYGVRDIASKLGVRPGTIRSRLYSGRWPRPDDTSGQTHLWFGSTIKAALTQHCT